jgi:hypothetical protein
LTLTRRNPVRIKPNPTNTTDPTLTDFVILHEGSTAPLFSILTSLELTVEQSGSQTEAVASNITVSGAGALTTEQAAQLAALNATLISSGVFSTAALANAPIGSGGFTNDDRTALSAIPATPAPSADAIAQAVEAKLVDEFAAIPDAGEIKTAIESSAVLAKQASVDDVAI